MLRLRHSTGSVDYGGRRAKNPPAGQCDIGEMSSGENVIEKASNDVDEDVFRTSVAIS
jgi:hypothetical protein